MIYIGIDNGLSGAIVAIEQPGEIRKAATMPTRNKTKGNEVDADALSMFFNGFLLSETTVLLETPGKFAKGVQAISSMWDSYGATRAVLETLRLRHLRITPQSWQKIMLPNCAKGDTKPAATLKARQLWPQETWLATPRSTTAHLGLIDAALIAEYGRRGQL
jgi:hypothetical protein